jgi:hypothetical protein
MLRAGSFKTFHYYVVWCMEISVKVFRILCSSSSSLLGVCIYLCMRMYKVVILKGWFLFLNMFHFLRKKIRRKASGYLCHVAPLNIIRI